MTYTLEDYELEELLAKAAEKGAKIAIKTIATYNFSDTCKLLGISRPTLQRRLKEGKIKQIDGKISGAEIMKYLNVTV